MPNTSKVALRARSVSSVPGRVLAVTRISMSDSPTIQSDERERRTWAGSTASTEGAYPMAVSPLMGWNECPGESGGWLGEGGGAGGGGNGGGDG